MLQKLTATAMTALTDIKESVMSSQITQNLKGETKANFVAGGVPTEFSSDATYPGHQCCSLYDADDFTWFLAKFCLDGLESRNVDMVLYAINDRADSYWCGKEVKY